MTSEPEPTPTRAPGHARSVARGLLVLGPHRGAHRVAIRAGVSVLVPLLALVLRGARGVDGVCRVRRLHVAVRTQPRSSRTSRDASRGRPVPHAVGDSRGPGVPRPESRWLVVPVGALLAAGGSLTSDAYGWHPPGPLFLVFGFAVAPWFPRRRRRSPWRLESRPPAPSSRCPSHRSASFASRRRGRHRCCPCHDSGTHSPHPAPGPTWSATSWRSRSRAARHRPGLAAPVLGHGRGGGRPVGPRPAVPADSGGPARRRHAARARRGRR